MSSLPVVKKRTKFGIFESALACIVFVLLNFLFVLGYSLLPNSMRANKAVYYLAQFLIEAVFSVASWIVATSTNVDLLSAGGFKKKVNGKIVGLGAVLAFVSIIAFAMLSYVFLAFLGLLGYTPNDSSIEINNFGSYLIYVIVLCLAPAVFEEMLFRGTIASGFKSLGVKMSVVLSALIFMIMHGSPDQTVHQFIVGMILGYLFIKSGNIWLGIITHFFNNFISVTQVYFVSMLSSGIPDDGAEVVDPTVATANPWVSLLLDLAIAIILAVAGYYAVKKIVKMMIDESDRINAVSSPETANANAANGLETPLIAETSNTETTSQNGEDRFKIDPKEFEISKSDFEINDEDKIKTETQSLSESQSNLTLTVAENGENKSLNADAEKQETEKSEKSVSMATLIMFVLSGGYLVFEWIMSLVSGFFR